MARNGPNPTPLAESLDAPRAALETSAGRIAYYAAGPRADARQRPLVLIHSINAAPSSYEVRPLFERFRTTRPVYSLDLPGFGFSERDAGPYRPERFADAIAAFLTEVVGRPADILALSLSCEFTARAARAVPALVASLVLISPTGFSSRPMPPPAVGRIAHAVLAAPGLAQGLYALVTSRPSIRYYLNKSFTGKAPDAMVDYAYATSHQPGARHAPLYFLSMQLFTPGAVERLYAPLGDLPVLVIADRDPYVTFERLAGHIAAHQSWRHERLAPNLGLPHWERPEETAAALEAFWSAV